ncbi:MAG: 4Fe-4S dicluster domain-containing protein, partial [Clostridia bacterium]|nr:4Fe-4S dicluster domain-containing protein [Clostridia bacterium]
MALREQRPPEEGAQGGRALWEACVHCGFCLPACPTYQETGLEELSPRGRVYLLRAAAEGRIGPDDAALLEPVDSCLDCRACEVVCPSGVRVGALIEEARATLRP